MTHWTLNAGYVAERAAIQAQEETLKQLNELLAKGIIEVESGPVVLAEDALTKELRISRTVKLHVRDKAYIERLEKENAELKQFKETIKAAYGETRS